MSAGIRYVIVGGGLAGAQAAQVLREEGATGPITLLGDEPLLPYQRPPLSKQYLQGVVARQSVFIHDQAWYDDQEVEVALESSVEVIRPDLRAIGLADGRTVPYDRLLLATGSSARSLDVPGIDLEGVMSLRRLGDCERIKQAFVSGQRMVVIGAGWIGLEVAAAGQGAVLDVTVVEVDGHPLMRVLGPELGVVFADLHAAHGVRVLTGRAVTGLRGRSGRVTGVHLADGAVLSADIMVVAVGARPNVDVAMASGIPVGNGVVVDEFLATGLPDVFAAGDVARRVPPSLPEARARGALGQRLASGCRGRAEHARPANRVRPAPVLLLRPVRRGLGVHQLRAAGRLRRGGAARRRRVVPIHRVLAVRPAGGGRHERQHVGRATPVGVKSLVVV